MRGPSSSLLYILHHHLLIMCCPFQRKDATNNKRKRLWGRGIINWTSHEGEDKGSVIALMQGPKKPKSRRRAAMSAHTAPCLNLYPPVACGPQTSRKLQQTPATDANLLANVAKLPLPIPVPVLDIGMLGTSVQTPEPQNPRTPAVMIKKEEGKERTYRQNI